MKKQDYIDLGFKELPHFTVGEDLTYDLGRKRQLSTMCVGTPNEMIFISQINKKNDKEIDDLICVHNYDYDGYMTRDKLSSLITVLVGSVAKSCESVSKNAVLPDVSQSVGIERMELLPDILGLNNPWSLLDTLKKLTKASYILLHEKNYDGHGWELIEAAQDSAKKTIELLEGNGG